MITALVLMSGTPGRADAAVISLTPHADTYLRDGTPRGGLTFMDVRGGAIDFRGYLRFDLSGLPAGSTITSATLQLTQVTGASRNDNILDVRFAAYGLNDVAGNTPQNWDEATFVPAAKGAEDVTTLAGVTDLDDNVAGISETFAGAAGSSVITLGGQPLADFLQARFDGGGLATFILSNDDAADRGYGLGTKENATPGVIPTLTVDVVPEPAGLCLIGGAALALVTRRRRR